MLRDVDLTSVEASDLGWAPGHWPLRLRRRDGRIFERAPEPVRTPDGEDLAGWRYVGPRGELLTVWND